jgi:hypothetical protein
MLNINNENMKKVIVMFAGMLTLGVVAAQAQIDSLQRTPVEEPANQYRMEDRVIVPSSEIPGAMRQTLKGNEYRGWEKSTIYRDKSNNNYYFDMKNGDVNRTYQFDQNGKPLNSTMPENTASPSPNSSGDPNRISK